MHDEVVEPGVELMASLRAVGYSAAAAIADVVDNSISANAGSVKIRFSEADAYVVILDDGVGMAAEVAREAMRLAGTGGTRRLESDLGRFGLGLKTASMSQCRQLTVVTKQGASLVALRWDLDYLLETGKWNLVVLDDDELDDIPHLAELSAIESGTLVLWKELDLFVATTTAGFDEQFTLIANHLQLVFHRFIARRVRISVGARLLTPVDPFLEFHPATQRLPEEVIRVGSASVTVRPFVLPYIAKLSKKDRDRGLVSSSSARDEQGFYVYRNERLLDWGSWFRLAPRNELNKLARVAIDLPNSMDLEWGLDIKKSRAIPPPIVRRELKRLIDRIVERSRSVHVYRGRPDSEDATVRVWNLVRDRETFRYEINRDHPLVVSAESGVGSLDQLLRTIEDSFPAQDLFNRLSDNQEHVAAAQPSEDEIVSSAAIVWRAYGSTMSFGEFVRVVSTVEPFVNLPDSAKVLQAREEEIVNGSI